MHFKSHKHFYVFPLLFLLSNIIYAQDTLSVYFDVGSHKLKKAAQQKLDLIQSNYYFSDIDKVSFIGYSDSTGNFASNIKLSERRANAVYKYCKSILPENVEILITAKGETNLKRTAEASRRVDIVFNYKKEEVEKVAETFINTKIEQIDTTFTDSIITATPKETCHYIDYVFLNRTHQQTITQKGKKYVLIETNDKKWKNRKYYYQHYNPKRKQWETKKVRWKTQTTGELWWRKQRRNTKIEVKDYEHSKIFQQVSADSCIGCNIKNRYPIEEMECLQVDSFVMINAQYKIKTLRGIVKIRVPRAYINLDDNYYFGCNKTNEIDWEEKRLFKRKKYYYTETDIDTKTFQHASITREMYCCTEEILPCVNNFGPASTDERCTTKDLNGFELNANVGTYLSEDEFKPFVGMDLSYIKLHDAKYSQFTVQSAVTKDLELFNKAAYNFHFYSFPIGNIKYHDSWSSFDELTPKNINGGLFTGISGNSLHDFEGENRFFGEAHVGINIFRSHILPFSFSNAYFLMGTRYDFFTVDSQIKPYYELGISFNLIK